tara:strand:- start:124 stop:1167 length:1044 start_codon:yes stop_codon:yes gene_type:complete
MNKNYPNIIEIKNYINKDCFEINTIKSITYLIKDIFLLTITYYFIYKINTSNIYLDIVIKLPLQFIAGFFMWCIFVIGHDCGHGTFSQNKFINNIFGELCHSIILLTPFYPWKKSHNLHHLNHNHVEKDYSHKWFLSENKDNILSELDTKIFYKLRYIACIFSWPMYLYVGIPDGGHLILYGRLWKDSNLKEIIRGYTSSFIVCSTFYLLWNILGFNIITYYLIPWLFYGWWLFTVTFLQHHDETNYLYNQKWNYIKGAFETIDRDYGDIINNLSHHITDCHVIHHIFFTKIPHYNLKLATNNLIDGLKKNNYINIYKKKNTYNFITYIFDYYIRKWHFYNKHNLDH